MYTYREGERTLPAAKAVCFHGSMNLLHGPLEVANTLKGFEYNE